MKRLWRLQFLVAVVLVGLVTAAWVSTAHEASADNATVTAAASSSLVLYAQEGEEAEGEEKGKEAKEAEYVGSTKCKMCHVKVYKSWETLAHAKSLDVLKPGEAKEAKEKAQLDPEKDYTKDAACLECHVVGFGKPGGFALKDDEKELAKMVKDLGHVGCESCHGAGGAYMDFHKQIQKEKKQYTLEEMKASGTIIADEATCKTCHNEKSPTFKPFNFEEAVKTGVHEKAGLELRKEGAEAGEPEKVE